MESRTSSSSSSSNNSLVLGHDAEERLRRFRLRVKELTQQRDGKVTGKPDMVAFSELRKQYLGPFFKKHGALPGVPIGIKVNGRGEAAILGIHTQIFKGIDALKQQPCYAVCMSGGYKDDDSSWNRNGEDGTLQFTYTGSGGRCPKTARQIKDQTLNCDNASLKEACRRGTYIRVIMRTSSKEPIYKYLGLVKCVSYSMEECIDGGAFVYKFVLEPVEGQFQLAGPSSKGDVVAPGRGGMGQLFPSSTSVMRNSFAANRRGSMPKGQPRHRIDRQMKQNQKHKNIPVSSNPVSVKGPPADVSPLVSKGFGLDVVRHHHQSKQQTGDLTKQGRWGSPSYVSPSPSNIGFRKQTARLPKGNWPAMPDLRTIPRKRGDSYSTSISNVAMVQKGNATSEKAGASSLIAKKSRSSEGRTLLRAAAAAATRAARGPSPIQVEKQKETAESMRKRHIVDTFQIPKKKAKGEDFDATSAVESMLQAQQQKVAKQQNKQKQQGKIYSLTMPLSKAYFNCYTVASIQRACKVEHFQPRHLKPQKRSKKLKIKLQAK